MGKTFRRLFYVLVLGVGAVLGSIFLAAELLLQDTPILAAAAPPDGLDVAATRKLVQDIRSASDRPQGRLETSVDQLNSTLRLGARFISGFRGQVAVNDGHLRGILSVPVSVPWRRGQRWLNVIGWAPNFSGRLVLSEIFVSDYSLPPDALLELARIGANLRLGRGLGDVASEAVTSMRITSQEDITFTLHLDEMGKNGMMRGTFGALKGGTLPSSEKIETFYLAIREAVEDGRLPENGSFLFYLQFTLRAALEDSTDATLPGRYAEAILGLAKACGAADFALIVGRLVFDKNSASPPAPAICQDVTLNDRVDSRRHFLTSAALQAISNTSFAVSAGEFKELYDTISGAGGFDFTDMTANLSGIRLSNVVMTTPRRDWPALLARLQTERDVIPSFDGIPQLMPEATFLARFGDINSAPYREMITRIGTRIDGLAFHTPD